MYRTRARSLKREEEMPAAKCVQDRKTARAGQIRIVSDDEEPRLRLLQRSLLSMRCAAASKDRNARFINFGLARPGCDLYPIFRAGGPFVHRKDSVYFPKVNSDHVR